MESKIPNSQFFFEPEALRHLVLRLCPQSFQRICSLFLNGQDRKKRKRPQHRTRMAMDFDPTPKTIRSQEGVEAYLIKYGVHLPSNVKSSGVLYTPNTQRLLRLGVCTFILKC